MGEFVIPHSSGSLLSPRRACLIAVLVFGAPPLLLADEDIRGELQRCAALDNATVRLDCYDKISGRQAQDEPVVAAPLAGPPETFGSQSLKHKKEAKVEEVAVVATVKRCTEGPYKKYIFYLDGGQVWKQISDKRLHFKKCDFAVSIRKDLFGFTMRQQGSKTKFRVSRIR